MSRTLTGRDNMQIFDLNQATKPHGNMERRTFPRMVLLSDTGERRYPKTGETYMWRNSQTGAIDGPHHCDDADEKTDWYGEPDCFAIFREEAPAETPAILAEVRTSLNAVLHQLQHGEASDFLDGTESDVEASRRDLCWCIAELTSVVSNISR